MLRGAFSHMEDPSLGAIPTAKPRRRVVSVRGLVHAFDGAERAYPVYRFSDRQVFERAKHNPFSPKVVALTVDPFLPTAQVGQVYAGVTWAVVSGHAEPHTFSVIAGALPPGLTINAVTGVVGGTPTDDSGSPYAYTVQAITTDPSDVAEEKGSGSSAVTVIPA